MTGGWGMSTEFWQRQQELENENARLREQLDAAEQLRLQAVSLIPHEVWNALPRETRLRLTDGLVPIKPVSNPASEPDA